MRMIHDARLYNASVGCLSGSWSALHHPIAVCLFIMYASDIQINKRSEFIGLHALYSNLNVVHCGDWSDAELGSSLSSCFLRAFLL